MDWKSFFASIVDSLAWPVVVLIVVILLKDKLSELLPRLKRFKHRDTEFEFAEKVSELVRESEAQGEVEPNLEGEEIAPDLQFDSLIQLAEISPRAAVVEAYRILEVASQNAVQEAYPNIDPKELRHPLRAKKLLVKSDILSEYQYDQLRDLRNLRNTAAHSQDFKLKGMPIEAYIDIALSLARQLGHARHNNQINQGQG
tara:strand:+ start:535 stop:1134 length:600 start_codon:yes stop_codon:yes gene_type:complete